MATKQASKQAASRELTKTQWKLKEIRQNWVAYLMVAPYMILFTLFTVVPVVLSIFISFTDFNMLEWPNIVWLKNYVTLFFDDDVFLIACKNTFIFAVIVGPASYLMSFLVAWFINELSPRTRSIVTLIFYAPSISGGAYTIFGYIFASDSYGLVNGWLLKFGFIDSPILFFTDVKWIMPLCVAIALWMSLGTSFLSFVAGLQGIDRAQFEAASVDGITNRWQELWYVTLPNMKPQLVFGSVMAFTGSFGFGGVVTALAGNPSTVYVAYTISHHIEEYGGARMEIGYSSAISFILFLIMITANSFIVKLLSKVGE